MKKSLLLGSALIASVVCMNAENNVYNCEELGIVYGVSDNGHFAAITDDGNNLAYLWKWDVPDIFFDISAPKDDESVPEGQRVSGTNAYDASDSGLVVGCIYYADGRSVPAYYLNDEWTLLPMPANVSYLNSATTVTPDGNIIGGYCGRPNEEVGIGQYFPVRWQKNASGDYELIDESDFDLGNHMGFYPRTMSKDGSIMAGAIYYGVGSCMPALSVNGELKMFDEIEIKYEPWIYKGKYYCGWGVDENGNDVQIWTDDPNDPRIVLYEETYINGFKDGTEKYLYGTFQDCDPDGLFYGCRTLITNLSESDPTQATLTQKACTYDPATDEWQYNNRVDAYTCGVGKDLIYAVDNKMLVDGQFYDINEYYGVAAPSTSFGASKISANGKVIGMTRGEFSEAIGDWMFFPYMIVTDDAYAGVDKVMDTASKVAFVVGRGHISVLNAEEATIYDVNGNVVAQGTSVDVNPGIYVVTSGTTTAKIMVK